MSFFLLIEAHRDGIGAMVLTQAKYVENLLFEVGMDGAKPMPTH